MRTEDGKIIKRCLDGEPEAFGLLVDKYKTSIFALVFTKIRNYHDAQDVTQEVFLKAYRDIRSLKRWDSFLWWLYSIAHNACKEWIRKQSSRPDFTFADQDELEVIMENSSMDAYNDNRMIEFLHEALDSLPNTYRKVLTLYYLGGMNSAEIAIALNTTPAAIRQQLSRARTQLKEGCHIYRKQANNRSIAPKERHIHQSVVLHISLLRSFEFFLIAVSINISSLRDL